jgi:hypothetical protein
MKRLVLLIVCIFSLIGCQNSPEAKDYACKEFSVNCEIEKDFLLIQPVVFDEKTIDVYGNQIVGRSDCKWYIICRNTKLMIPVNFSVCTGYERIGDAYSPVYSECPTPVLINNCKDKWAGMVRSDSTDLSSIIPGLKKAIVVVSGPNEILVTGMWPTLALAKKNSK